MRQVRGWSEPQVIEKEICKLVLTFCHFLYIIVKNA